jgi:hypothetical protein
VMLYDRPLADTLTSAELSEEVIRTLVGSIGLVLAIPVTTLIAVLVVKATGVRAGAPEAPAPQAPEALGQDAPGVTDTGSLAAAALNRQSRLAAGDQDDAPATRRGRRADRG